MTKKTGNAEMIQGSIDVAKIAATHARIKEIVLSYNNANREVAQITQKIKENWVGAGRNEFETQYKILISKIDDFGDTLKEIYDALVAAEADYKQLDDKMQKQITMAIKK